MRPQADNHQIIDFIKQYGPVATRWDAGGDSCVVHFNNEVEIKAHDDVLYALRECIIEKLNLPDVGEEYDKGYGRIHLTHENTVVITYTSRRLREVDDYETTYVEQVVDDPLNLRRYLDRMTIGFVAYSGDTSEYEGTREIGASYYAVVTNGESLPYDKADLNSYMDIPKELLRQTLALPIPERLTNTDVLYELDYIQVDGKLTQANTITFEISQTFNISQHTLNKTEVLI